MATETGWIYAVHDDDGAVVYVGKTVETPAERYRGHLRDALAGSATAFHRWLRLRIQAGDVPRVSTLERPPLEKLGEREASWIHRYSAERGGNLLNTAGRSDVPGPELQETARVIALRSKIAAAIPRTGDGPVPEYSILHDAGFSYVEDKMKALVSRLLNECLSEAGWACRGGSYWVRVGTMADRLTDPSVGLADRVALWFSVRQSKASGIQLGPLAHKLCATDMDVKAHLASIGYKLGKHGLWFMPRRIDITAIASSSELGGAA